ncbi:unnamed protein product [Prorocentrum cordatum]|uniref:Uncharacterized protein n=1 Tax=Prorocentrum cordatum TaxID=2364126 RepID=A0ABN9V2H0_9DINO|nr:unnamed protein product [Polarella glacialis]
MPVAAAAQAWQDAAAGGPAPLWGLCGGGGSAASDAPAQMAGFRGGRGAAAPGGAAAALVTGSRRRRPSAFSENQETVCPEGFRCISRVGRFGYGHSGKVRKGLEKGVPESELNDYEWGCPVHGVWKPDSFEAGKEDGLCREDRDCLCASRGWTDGYSTLEGGKEKITGKFEYQLGTPAGGTSKKDLTLTPHYPMRKMPDEPLFDIANPHSDFGKVSWLPREEWLKEFKQHAPRVQLAMDQLRDWIDATNKNNVKNKIPPETGKPILCISTLTPKDAFGKPIGEPAFSSSEVQDVAGRLRRFQSLMHDCKKLRDNVAKLSPGTMSDDVKFGEGGNYRGNRLNCYKKDGEQECLQLNCYTDDVDMALRHRVRDWKSQVDECVSEELYKLKMRKNDGTEKATATAQAPGQPALQPQPNHVAEAHGEAADGVAGEAHRASCGPVLALCALARPRGAARPRAGAARRPRPAASRARHDAAAFL